MAERYDIKNNDVEPVSGYVDLVLDTDNRDSVTPNTIIMEKPITPTLQPVKKRFSRNQIIGFSITFAFALLAIFIIVLFSTRSSPLISKYENKSNFSNKDQFEDPTTNDYDIHYLVEQMIYKEFTPADKKKYLNLPQTLKENLMFDYLIDKI